MKRIVLVIALLAAVPAHNQEKILRQWTDNRGRICRQLVDDRGYPIIECVFPRSSRPSAPMPRLPWWCSEDGSCLL
jgi:hypothetical protein